MNGDVRRQGQPLDGRAAPGPGLGLHHPGPPNLRPELADPSGGASATGAGVGPLMRDMRAHLFDPSAADDAFHYDKLKAIGKGAYGKVWLCKGHNNPEGGGAEVPREFALKEVLSPHVFHPNDPEADVADSLPLNEPALQFYHQHPNIVQVFWAHVICLDPQTQALLPVKADQILPPHMDIISPLDPHSGPVRGVAALAAHHMHGLDAHARPSDNGAWAVAQVAPAAHEMHAGHSGHGSAAGSSGVDVERTALPLHMYSDPVHVTQYADGQSPPDDSSGFPAPAAAGNVPPDPAGAGPAPLASAYPPGPGPATCQRILADEKSRVAIEAAVWDQRRVLQEHNSGLGTPGFDVSPADPPVDAQHAPAAHAPWGGAPGVAEPARRSEEGPPIASDWLSRVDRACRVAAAQSAGGGGGGLDGRGGVQLQMRIAMEYCELGSLANYLSETARGAQPLAQRVSMHKCRKRVKQLRCVLLTALDVAEALRCMHASNVLHGDLKPHNILLAADPKDDRGFHAKVTDFGLAVHMAQESTFNGQQGTEAYMPPQVFLDYEMTRAGDIYALGLVLWEMLHGVLWCYVWAAEKRARGVHDPLQMDFFRPLCQGWCDDQVAALVYKCIRSNPNSRPSAEDLCGHLRAALTELAPPAPELPRGHAAHAAPNLVEFQVPPGLSHNAGHSAGIRGAQQGAHGHGASAGLQGVRPGQSHRLPDMPQIAEGQNGAGEHAGPAGGGAQHAQHGLRYRGPGALGNAVHDEKRLWQWEQRDLEDEQARREARVVRGWFQPEEEADAAPPGCLRWLRCGGP